MGFEQSCVEELQRVVIIQQLDRFVNDSALLAFVPLRRLPTATLGELGCQRLVGSQRRSSCSPSRHCSHRVESVHLQLALLPLL